MKSAYIIKCTGIKKDSDGNVEEIYCEYDPDTRSGMPGSMRKVKGTLHWVSAEYSSTAEVRLYDRLFNVENPAEEKDMDFISGYYLFFLGLGLWQSVKTGRRPEVTALVLGLELPVCGRMLGIW